MIGGPQPDAHGGCGVEEPHRSAAVLDADRPAGVELIEGGGIEKSGNGLHIADAADPAGGVGGAVQGGAEIAGAGHLGWTTLYRRRGRSQRVEVDVMVVETRDECTAVGVDDVESRCRVAREVHANRGDHAVDHGHVADALGE